MTMNLTHTASETALCRRCRHYSHSCYMPCAMNPLGPAVGQCADFEQLGPRALPTSRILPAQCVQRVDQAVEDAPTQQVPRALQILQSLVAFLVMP
jgi:hypothetical protein